MKIHRTWGAWALVFMAIFLSQRCSASEEVYGAKRQLLQQASNCTSNGRLTENGMSCCFPAVYRGVSYNDCWAIDDDPYCYVSTRSSRSTLARCLPRGSTTANATTPQAFRDGFSSVASNATSTANTTAANATLPQAFRDGFSAVNTTANSTNSTLPQAFRDGFSAVNSTSNSTSSNSTLPQAFRDGFSTVNSTTNSTTNGTLPQAFIDGFSTVNSTSNSTTTNGTLPQAFKDGFSTVNATRNSTTTNGTLPQAFVDSFGNIMESNATGNASSQRAPTPAVRYTINDQRCVFPIALSNGTVVYDCFSIPSLTDTSSEASAATGQQYCLISSAPGSQPVQCAVAGYTPNDAVAPAGLCPNAIRRTTDTGKTCTFPQRTFKKEWVCGCYSLRDGSVVKNESATQAYCVPDGMSAPVLCAPLGASNTTTNGTNTASTSSTSSSSSSSSNTGLIIGLAVGIPLGLLAIAGVAGGVWYYKKQRPMAKATSFTKWDGGDGNGAISKGSISSKDIAKSGTGLSSVSKYAEPI